MARVRSQSSISNHFAVLSVVVHCNTSIVYIRESGSCCRYRPDVEKECLAHRLGRHYLGTERRSASGKTCLPWTDGPTQMTINLPDASTTRASNFCRYIPRMNWSAPSCLVNSGTGYLTIEPCNIPYCGGKSVRAGKLPQVKLTPLSTLRVYCTNTRHLTPTLWEEE